MSLLFRHRFLAGAQVEDFQGLNLDARGRVAEGAADLETGERGIVNGRGGGEGVRATPWP